MTDARQADDGPDDPLLRAVAEHWDEIKALADPQQRERLTGLITGTTEPDPAEARAALADELLDLLPPDHPVIRIPRAGTMYSPGADTGLLDRDLAIDQRIPSVVLSMGDVSTMPVTIYLSDGEIYAEVENAVECLLATAGLRIEDRDDPVVGS